MKLRKKFKHRAPTLAAFNRAQGDFDQLDAGAYLELDPFVFGICTAVCPSSPGSAKATSTTMQSHGGRLPRRQLQVWLLLRHHGLPTERRPIRRPHELSLSYAWANKRDPRLSKRRIIPCSFNAAEAALHSG